MSSGRSHPRRCPKTGIITPFSLFKFLCMLFGLRNAMQTFQRKMDQLFCGLPFTFVYLDDLLVASCSREYHLVHLREVFSLLQQQGLVINPSKCCFTHPTVDFLGHIWIIRGDRTSPGSHGGHHHHVAAQHQGLAAVLGDDHILPQVPTWYLRACCNFSWQLWLANKSPSLGHCTRGQVSNPPRLLKPTQQL